MEGDGSDRVELQFYAALNSIYADASNWLASLSAPTGIEFWTSPTGGSSMTAAQVNATITAGPLNRDFWVSAATAGSQTSTITLNYVKTVGEVENASTFVTTVGTGTWAVDGTWKETLTPGGTDVFSGTGAANLPMAVASGGPASLKRLAYDITGNQNNWSQIGVPGGSTEPNDPDEVKPGTEVDVSKLLADLDVQVRGEVASAARVKVKNATFGNTPAGTLIAAQISAILVRAPGRVRGTTAVRWSCSNRRGG